MKVVSSVAEMQFLARTYRKEGRIVGFVPTMGFLHDGHLSLMRKAGEENDVVVASIFVNPTQFGPTEDLARYPRDDDGDRRKCESADVDVLFLPGASAMYPEGSAVFVTVEDVGSVLEGAMRRGHFRGVATVVAKLFNIVMPHRAYFGQKDYQQCVVIRRMVAGLNMDIEIAVLPIIRETDGLAMSSRNSYLDAGGRRKATALFRALQAGADLIQAGVHEPEKVRQKMRAVMLAEPGVEVDYAEVADPETLVPLESFGGRVVLLVAARVGTTRLIDNMIVPCA